MSNFSLRVQTKILGFLKDQTSRNLVDIVQCERNCQTASTTSRLLNGWFSFIDWNLLGNWKYLIRLPEMDFGGSLLQPKSMPSKVVKIREKRGGMQNFLRFSKQTRRGFEFCSNYFGIPAANFIIIFGFSNRSRLVSVRADVWGHCQKEIWLKCQCHCYIFNHLTSFGLS